MTVKLVTIGDSLTHGVQSGAVSRTDLSYPAMIAECLGEINKFRLPDFQGEGGLPLNLERLFRLLTRRYGAKINWLEVVPASLTVRSFLDRVEDYWERGEGTEATSTGDLHHNLAILSTQLGDCDTLTEAICRRHIPVPRDNFINQVPEYPMYRAARRTLNPSFDVAYEHLSQVAAAKKIADDEGGIENLIFWLGSNNCLGTVINLEIHLSTTEDLERLPHQRHCNLWHPEHFAKLLKRVAPQIEEIGAKHVYTSTIPHVTIPPVSRGISLDRTQELSSDNYYEYYTHFWVWDEDFRQNPEKYRPYLTREDARYIDNTIDEYNQIIRQEAKNRGWHVVDVSSQLDSLAFRRKKGHPTYQFPTELVTALKANPDTQERFTDSGRPILDTRYLRIDTKATDPQIKYQGGIFSLDGIHPTTIAYGLIAANFLNAMEKEAGVKIDRPLDWDKIVRQDSLIADLPRNLSNLRDTIGFLYSQRMLLSLIQCFSV